MPDERLQKRAALEGALHRASDAVHQICGRTDMSLADHVRDYPQHNAVKAWREARDALKKFDEVRT